MFNANNSNYAKYSDWKPITFTGTFAGQLDGYHNDKIGIISYQGQANATGDYLLTIDVTPKVVVHTSLRYNGYMHVNTNQKLTISGVQPWTVGELVFPIA